MEQALAAQTEWTRAVPSRSAPRVSAKRLTRCACLCSPSHPPPPSLAPFPRRLPLVSAAAPAFQVIFDPSCTVQASSGAQVSPADMQVCAHSLCPRRRARPGRSVPASCHVPRAASRERRRAAGCCAPRPSGRCAGWLTVDGESAPARARQVMATAFNDKDTTFGNGINIAGVNHEVHRFYEEDGELLRARWHALSACVSPSRDPGAQRPSGTPPAIGSGCSDEWAVEPAWSGLIYGRTHSVDPREGEGFCLARAAKPSGIPSHRLSSTNVPTLALPRPSLSRASALLAVLMWRVRIGRRGRVRTYHLQVPHLVSKSRAGPPKLPHKVGRESVAAGW